MQTPVTFFQLAFASVQGGEHQRLGRNNQDALAVARGERHLALVLADGCSASPHSEAGALLGSRLFAGALLRALEPGASCGGVGLEEALERATSAVLAHLAGLARQLCPEPEPGDRALAAAVRDSLLFTLVGAVLGPEQSLVFALGDGLAEVNGEAHALGPFAGNEPPYLAYALLPPALHGFAPEALRPKVLSRLATFALETLALGTDGALELGRAGAAPLALFREPRLFENPDALRRRLFLLSRQQPGRPAALRDDTTLALLRRAPQATKARPEPGLGA
jgi:Protein phosphatase 2C